MENISFLKDILMSTSEYWIVAKQTNIRECFETKRGIDHIIFISIPQGIRRGLKYEEITLQELEKLKSTYCDTNIYMDGNFTPFQLGLTFYNIYKGYPVEENIKQFVIDALKLNGSDIYKYKELINNSSK